MGPNPPSSSGPPPHRGPSYPVASIGRPSVDLALVVLEHARRVHWAPSQRELAQELLCSQPTASRLLGRLTRERWATGVPSWSVGKPGGERRYFLTPAGVEKARFSWDRLKRHRVGSGEWTAEDLMDLNPDVRVVDGVLIAALGIPVSVTDPSRALARLAELRGGVVSQGPPGPTPPVLRLRSAAAEDVQMVGRSNERAAIVRALRPAEEGSRNLRALFLSGPLGVGKTRLIRFAHEVGERRGFRVVAGRVFRHPSFPFSPFEEIFRDREETSAMHSPAGTEPTSFAERVLGYRAQFERWGRSAPYLISLDDLHWITPSAVEALRFLLRNLPPTRFPLVIVGAARDDEVMPEREIAREVQAAFEEWGRAGGETALLRVRPLADPEARRLANLAVSSRAGGDRTTPFLDAVLRRARGNPLFILESLRALGEPEEARTETAGESVGAPHAPGRIPVPENLARLVWTRVERLPGGLRALLETASLMGEQFDERPLAYAVRADGRARYRQVRDGLRELTDRQGLLRRVGPGRYAFRHAILQETLYLYGGDQHLRARRLADWWARFRAGEVATVARLYYDARDSSRALPWIQQAIDRALTRQAWEATLEYLEWLRELFSGTEQDRHHRFPVELAAAERLWVAGAATLWPSRAGWTAQRLLIRLLAEPRLPPPVRWQAEVLLANTLAETEPKGARGRLSSLERELSLTRRDLPKRRAAREIAGRCYASGAYVAQRQLRWRTSLRLADLAQRWLGPDDHLWRLWAMFAGGMALLHAGRNAEVLACCARGRKMAQAQGAESFRALFLNLQGRAHLVRGEISTAARCFDLGKVVSRNVGNVPLTATLLGNRAFADLQRGRPAPVRRAQDELGTLCHQFDLPVHLAWRGYREGQLAWAHGRTVEACDLFRDAEKGFRNLGLNAYVLPQTYLLTWDGVSRHDVENLRKLGRLAPRMTQVFAEERLPMELFRAEVLHSAGRRTEALRELREGLTRVRSQGRGGDERWFENALTVAGSSPSRPGGVTFTRLGVRGPGAPCR